MKRIFFIIATTFILTACGHVGELKLPEKPPKPSIKKSNSPASKNGKNKQVKNNNVGDKV